MKKILILNGAARKNGATNSLVKAFREGAEGAGNEVREIRLYDLNVKDCIGCMSCDKSGRSPESPCVFKDDMEKVYPGLLWAEVLVFASPIYWWGITGITKTVVDRFFAQQQNVGIPAFRKSTVLLLTAGGRDYSHAMTWYGNFKRVVGWPDLGTVLGAGKEDEARAIGAGIE